MKFELIFIREKTLEIDFCKMPFCVGLCVLNYDKLQ